MSATALGYGATLVMVYLSLTPPSSLVQNFRELDQALFRFRELQPSLIERLLETPDGPMNRGGTMRPAFTTQSDDWESATQAKTPEELDSLLEEREAERLAVLNWVRSGAPREAYERDENLPGGGRVDGTIAAEFMAMDQRIRIRSIINARCVSCHREGGRNDRACWFPLDSYERIERYCRPERIAGPSSFWPITALISILPLTAISGLMTWWTSLTRGPRIFLTILPVLAAILAIAAWLGGSPNTVCLYFVLAGATLASMGLLLQAAVILHETTSR
ncbi:MAG TPA: hypothetical protein VGI40_04145 [Pirellulaceae bacterium]